MKQIKGVISLQESIDNFANQDPYNKQIVYVSNCLNEILGKITERRKELKLSQRDLAKLIDKKQPMIARIENLENIPRLSTLIEICYCLGLEIKCEAREDS